jgi:hypothetical protein
MGFMFEELHLKAPGGMEANSMVERAKRRVGETKKTPPASESLASQLLRISVTWFGDGLTMMLRRSKVDQGGAGRKVGIPYGSNPETCPVRVLQTWIEQAAITTGLLFRSINRHGKVQRRRLSGIDVARIVKKLVDRAGLDAAKYAGHSLRAGHATSAAIAGASERSIMNQTGHKSVQMVRRYIREGSLFRENSAGKLGL